MRKNSRYIVSLFVAVIIEIVIVKVLGHTYHLSQNPIYPIFVWIIIATTVVLLLMFVLKRGLANGTVRKLCYIFLALIWIIGLGYFFLSMFGLDFNQWFMNFSKKLMWNI